MIVVPVAGEGTRLSWFLGNSNADPDLEISRDHRVDWERQRRVYEAILSNTPDLAYVFDLRHRFAYANEGLLRMWGRTWEEAIGKTEPKHGPSCGGSERWVRVWVEDNGIGISPNHQSQIFRLFVRLHGDAYRGTALGLAIVAKSVERLGGRVGVESETGAGSRFWFELKGL